MSIEGKHAYRFVYLKSEQWQAVRLEALVREKGKCQICGEESVSNDAHHAWYPESIWDTSSKQLVVLCRPCHDFIHSMMPECKTNDEKVGKESWHKFANAVSLWRIKKCELFNQPVTVTYPLGAENLRKRLIELDAEIARLKKIVREGNYSESASSVTDDIKSREFMADIVKKIKKFLENT